MKYFVLQDSPELKNAPQITRWYEQIDVRDIRQILVISCRKSRYLE